MGIREFSDAELAQALRCCGSVELGCERCPAEPCCENVCKCADTVVIEVADRIEQLSRRLDSAAGMILRLDDERRQAGG